MTAKLQRIIVSRTDAIGDVVLTLPLVGLLRRELGCEVIFLGKRYTQPVVACCPDVARFVDWENLCRTGSLDASEEEAAPSKPVSSRQVAEALRQLEADAIIHVLPNRAVARAARRAKIPIRIGTSHRIFHWPTCNRVVRLSRRRSNLHEAQLNLLLADPLLGDRCRLSLDEVRALMHFVPPVASPAMRHLLDPGRFNLVLHPKSNGSAREWPLNHYLRMVDDLPLEKFKIFVCGTADEGKQAAPLAMSSDVVNLCGQFSLEEYIAFLGIVDGIVACSTGPLHLTAAAGRHAVGLYTSRRPMHSGRWAPLGPHVHIFDSKRVCPGCDEPKNCLCMADIDSADVASALCSLPKLDN